MTLLVTRVCPLLAQLFARTKGGLAVDFLFEKLEACQHALSLVESIDALIDSLKSRFPATRIDQLTRASLSIPRSIAE